jgi:transposase
LQGDPLDLEGKTYEKRIQMAIQSIERNSFHKNGDPIYPFREAALTFKVSRTTLTARFKGRQTRNEAHEKEMKLSPAQEDVLAEWIKEKGRRNIPLHLSAVAEHARIILGKDIGECWVQKFRARRSDLKTKWATKQANC